MSVAFEQRLALALKRVPLASECGVTIGSSRFRVTLVDSHLHQWLKWVDIEMQALHSVHLYS